MKAWWARRSRFAACGRRPPTAWPGIVARLSDYPGGFSTRYPCKHVKASGTRRYFLLSRSWGNEAKKTKTCTSVLKEPAVGPSRRSMRNATEPPFLCKEGRL